MTDERMGLPSASGMWRNSNCPGNRELVRSLREKGILKGDNSSADSRLGDRIHASLAGEPLNLEEKEEETKNACEKLAALVAATYFGRDPQSLDRILYEQRFWYHIGETPFFSGKPDRVYLDPVKILDINFKTGRGEEEDAHLNLQLRTEVVLLKHCYPQVQEIGAVIIQPWVTHTPEIAIYGEDELQEALIEILSIVDRTFWSEDRHAGPWCRWCPARAFCPEARQLALTSGRIVNVEALPVGQEGAQLLERVMIAEKILEALKSAYKQRVADQPGCIPGWRISEGDRKRQWTDIGAALQKANEFLDLEQFADVPFGRLEDALKAQWNKTGKSFEAAFEKEFGDLITVTRAAGKLQRVPKRLRE